VTDDLDRVIFGSLEMFATGVMASFHPDISSEKPWNPILGETFVCVRACSSSPRITLGAALAGSTGGAVCDRPERNFFTDDGRWH
jgi:hypothetical protein